MKRSAPPTFPDFAWDGYFWATSAALRTWSGYQARNGPYGSVSSKSPSDGTVHIHLLREGQLDNRPLSSDELALVKWAIENETAVHDAVIEGLFEDYPTIREQYLDFFDFDDEAEADKVLPKIQSPVELKRLVGIVSMSVHSITKDEMPFIGVELGSTWEVEHGVGVLLHGAKVLEIGGADTAFTRWIVRKYATKE